MSAAGLAGKSDDVSDDESIASFDDSLDDSLDDSSESSASFSSFSLRSMRAVSISNGGIRSSSTSNCTSGSLSRIENLRVTLFAHSHSDALCANSNSCDASKPAMIFGSSLSSLSSPESLESKRSESFRTDVRRIIRVSSLQ